MPVSIDRRTPADTPSDVWRPPAFCRLDLPLCPTPMGACPWCSSLRACTSNGAPHPRALPGQAPRWGADTEAYECTSPEGAGGTGATASHARRKERNAVQLSGGIPKGVLHLGRTFGDFSCVRKVTPAARPAARRRRNPCPLGTFSCARESTPPAGAGTGKSHRACRHPRRKDISYLLSPISYLLSPLFTLHSPLSPIIRPSGPS